MKRLLAFVTLFWLSLAAAICLWWVRTIPRRPAPTWSEPEDGVQPYDPRTVVTWDEVHRWGPGWEERLQALTRLEEALGRQDYLGTWTDAAVRRLAQDVIRGETSIPEG